MTGKIEFITLTDITVQGLVNQINMWIRGNKESDIDIQSVVVTQYHVDNTPQTFAAILKTYSKKKK